MQNAICLGQLQAAVSRLRYKKCCTTSSIVSSICSLKLELKWSWRSRALASTRDVEVVP
jgi:hypothetical protein